MGIPERRLNNGPPIAKFAINIKNLRRVCKNTTGPAGPAGAAAKKRVTSRKTNSPGERKNASAKRAVHQNRGPGWPLLEPSAKTPPRLVQHSIPRDPDGSHGELSQILAVLNVGRARLRRIDVARRGIERRAPEILRADADLTAPRRAPRNAQIERRP